MHRGPLGREVVTAQQPVGVKVEDVFRGMRCDVLEGHLEPAPDLACSLQGSSSSDRYSGFANENGVVM